VTVKSPELVPVPPSSVVIEIFPVEAPNGIVTVAVVAEALKVFSADRPLNLISVMPVKLPPVIVTTVPAGPEVTPL
jgi:hypothetical protein